MLERNLAEKVMKERGYESVSHNESGGVISALNFVKQLNDQITIYAKVELKQECVSLSFVELKYFCQLCCNRFAFDHRDFEKYEQILMIYAAKCLDVDVFQVLALLPLKVDGVNDGVNDGVKPKKDIKERKRELWDEVVAVGKKRNYSKDQCLAFYNHWVAMNPGGVKMQFEIIRTRKGVFDVGGRMATWMKNDKDWASAKKNVVEKKAEQQDQEKVSKKPSLKKDEVF